MFCLYLQICQVLLIMMIAYEYYNLSVSHQIMQFKQKVQSMYKSGRYECDYDFYVRLANILHELNIYQWNDILQKQIRLVKDIRDLAEANSKSLQDDYNEEEAVSQTHTLKNLIGNLNTKDIPQMIYDCEAQNWQSLETKLHRQLGGDNDYEVIIERIKSTIHSEQLRIDSMIFVGCFQALHGNRVTQICQIYYVIIDYYLDFLSQSRSIVQTLGQSSDFSNVCSLPKTRAFIITLSLILKTILRFCEIVKVLTGQSNLSLKFTGVKKELQKVIHEHPEWNWEWPKEQLFAILPEYKEYLKNPSVGFSKQKICRWCFKALRRSTHQHFFCHEIIAKKSEFLIRK